MAMANWSLSNLVLQFSESIPSPLSCTALLVLFVRSCPLLTFTQFLCVMLPGLLERSGPGGRAHRRPARETEAYPRHLWNADKVPVSCLSSVRCPWPPPLLSDSDLSMLCSVAQAWAIRLPVTEENQVWEEQEQVGVVYLSLDYLSSTHI